jgi:hypothetical protein
MVGKVTYLKHTELSENAASIAAVSHQPAIKVCIPHHSAHHEIFPPLSEQQGCEEQHERRENKKLRGLSISAPSHANYINTKYNKNDVKE